MLKMPMASAASLLLLVKSTSAVDCSTHSFTSCADNIVHWFDPDTGQICDPLDCGGARAPFRSDVPGCPGYTGTEVRSTSYLSCWSSSGSEATAVTTSGSSEPEETGATEMSTSVSVVVKTSTVSSTQGGAEDNTASTTAPPDTSATADATASDSPSDASDTAAEPEPTNAGSLIHVPLIAVAGAAMGAVVLV